MANTIAVANHKGGVGKTSAVVNLGAAMAAKGKRVLLVDLDPQANLSQSLGVGGASPTVYDAIKGREDLTPIEVAPGLYVVPSSIDLSGAEVELSATPGREYILRELLDPIAEGFDFVLIDTPPSLGVLTINALTAARSVLVPIQAHFLALQGLDRMREVIDLVRKRLNRKLEIGGAFLTQYDARRILNRDVAEALGKREGVHLFRTFIRDNIAIAEAPVRGLDIFRHAPHSAGASDFSDLAAEVVKLYK